MKKRIFTFVCAMALPLLGRAEDAPTPERVMQLVREYAFSFAPDLNTNTQFVVRRLKVKGLWEQLRVEVFDIQYQIRGRWFNGFVGIYHQGKVSPLTPTVGGPGLMSGLMCNGDFVYTYAWGSGLHRSHVARLQVQGGQLKHSDSGGFMDVDLFVSQGPGGEVRVESGRYRDFNRWKAAKKYGVVATNTALELQIIDPKGSVVLPSFPNSPDESQPRR